MLKFVGVPQKLEPPAAEVSLRSMIIIPAEELRHKSGPANWFTGDVQLEELNQAGAAARVVRVTFAPGARTAWHTHPHGQLLLISEGVARVQAGGEPRRDVPAGAVVWFPPGERHWHGAAPGARMVHVAIQQADESGGTTTWLEHVSAAEYDGTARPPGA